MNNLLRKEAEKWVFETNGHRWSNNDNTAGDNYGSFIAGATSKYVQAEKIKAQILILKNVQKVMEMNGEYAPEISNEINELNEQLKELENEH